MFSFGLNASDLRRIAYTAVFAFLGVFATLASGAGQFHNFSDAKAAVLALLPAAIAAALSAVKNGVLTEGSKLK